MEHSSYLIQRLMKSFVGEPKNLFETISAYGLPITGFNKEAKELIRQFCRFDYMGSAEFEFGAIPKTLAQLIVDRKKLTAKAYPVPFYFKDFLHDKVIEGTKLVFVIAKEEDHEEIVKRICAFAVNDPAYRTKERVQLNEALAEYEYAKDIVGWLEIDNGYMFFIEQTMFKNFCALFGLNYNA